MWCFASVCTCMNDGYHKLFMFPIGVRRLVLCYNHTTDILLHYIRIQQYFYAANITHTHWEQSCGVLWCRKQGAWCYSQACALDRTGHQSSGVSDRSEPLRCALAAGEADSQETWRLQRGQNGQAASATAILHYLVKERTSVKIPLKAATHHTTWQAHNSDTHRSYCWSSDITAVTSIVYI